MQFPWGKKCPRWKWKPLAGPFLTTWKDLISRMGSVGWGMREKSEEWRESPLLLMGRGWHGAAREPQAQDTFAFPKMWF